MIRFGNRGTMGIRLLGLNGNVWEWCRECGI